MSHCEDSIKHFKIHKLDYRLTQVPGRREGRMKKFMPSPRKMKYMGVVINNVYVCKDIITKYASNVLPNFKLIWRPIIPYEMGLVR